jgi:sec-independent protein translocase protein TatB
MLDLGLTKMALIGVVALVVLGPERLPRVARTAGALFGRAQRYVNDVKAEVTREIELEELRRMKTDFETAARNVENTVHSTVHREEAALTEAFQAGMPATSTIAGGEGVSSVEEVQADASGTPVAWDSAGTLGDDDYSMSPAKHGSNGSALAAAKRRNWRVKRSATPVWYKRATASRTHIQSGAARVARHTPASLRTPKRFL